MAFESEISYYNDLIDARTRIEELEKCIRELLKGGEHDGDCTNDEYQDIPCWKHIDANDRREDAAKKLLGESK